MIIRDELPFSHVEGIGFREFFKEAQRRFDLPSRTIIGIISTVRGACLEMEKVDTKTMIPLDVCTRWNSTYMMSESALKLQKGFEMMEEVDTNFLGYFEEYEVHGKEKKKRVGPPILLDWDNTKEIDAMMNVDDVVMCQIATMIKRKFDKYWGNVNNINKLFFAAIILDP
ncbi:hypothetical protein L3X38_005019 [Prunus dulcis]|uniref:Uncharacterized protein n=1 Tax=Prunus dulcis TaxID=3755 RepID=A0AAD5F3U4_PRUDU|nr:hypothetical protein L3X38_005019 [Prunus dulcis]